MPSFKSIRAAGELVALFIIAALAGFVIGRTVPEPYQTGLAFSLLALAIAAHIALTPGLARFFRRG